MASLASSLDPPMKIYLDSWRHSLQGEFYLGTMPSTNGGSSSDAGVDDVDGHAIDPVRTQQAIDHLQQKIHKTMELIKAEQNAKEGRYTLNHGAHQGRAEH